MDSSDEFGFAGASRSIPNSPCHIPTRLVFPEISKMLWMLQSGQIPFVVRVPSLYSSETLAETRSAHGPPVQPLSCQYDLVVDRAYEGLHHQVRCHLGSIVSSYSQELLTSVLVATFLVYLTPAASPCRY